MRALAYVERIKALSSIPNADAIEKAEVLGWEVVVKKGEFQVGDLVVYCEIDSILPDAPPFEFLRSKNFRIKTVKLRGQISQGIVFQLATINQIDSACDIISLKVGDDVTGLLKITKYDPEAALEEPEPQEKKSWIANKYSYFKWKVFGIKKIKTGGNFPHDVPKTDETRVQKMGSFLENNLGKSVYITEKCEGTSFTVVYRKSGNWLSHLFGQHGFIQVCSRNNVVYNSQKRTKSTNPLYQVAVKYNIEQGLKKLNRNLAIQGECIGPKIQGNIYKLPNFDLKVFLIYDLDQRKYLPYQESMDIVAQLGLSFVPIVDTNATIVNDIKYYVELSKGKSSLNPSIDREGIVIRGINEDFSFKSINPEYLLKQE